MYSTKYTSLEGMTDEHVKYYGVQICSASASGKSMGWFWTLGCLNQRKNFITKDRALDWDTLLGTQSHR